ncbi:hypothetical protein BDV12DRAFT_186263 [Aspergillus spectabilis]
MRLFGMGIGFIAFDSIIIALRIYARDFMLRALGTDDILMIIGAILNFGLSITIMTGSNCGIGKQHRAYAEGMHPIPCILVTRLLYTLSMGLVKMSLLWFYLHLDHHKYMRWAVFFVMFFDLSTLFWTNPTSSRCMPMGPQQTFYEVNGILNIVTDILTYLLPKGAIMEIFGLGILSIAAIFCGCAPSLSVLTNSYAPSIFDSSAAKYPGSAQSPGASYLHQDAIVTVSNPDQDRDGIMMKTDIQMDVAARKSTEDHYFARRVQISTTRHALTASTAV